MLAELTIRRGQGKEEMASSLASSWSWGMWRGALSPALNSTLINNPWVEFSHSKCIFLRQEESLSHAAIVLLSEQADLQCFNAQRLSTALLDKEESSCTTCHSAMCPPLTVRLAVEIHDRYR